MKKFLTKLPFKKIASTLTALIFTASFAAASAEAGTGAAGRTRQVNVWAKKPGRDENHFWDCGILCAVGASEQGLVWSAASAAGQPVAPRKPAKHISLAEQAKKRER